jgi:hypothetical protein
MKTVKWQRTTKTGKAEKSSGKSVTSVSFVVLLILSLIFSMMSSKTPSESRASSVKPEDAAGDAPATENGQLVTFPSSVEVNGRLRRLITSFQREFKKEEARQAAQDKRNERRERIEAVIREREQQKIDAQQKAWSSREQSEFLKTLTAYGVDYRRKDGKYSWERFRQLTGRTLEKKFDDTLTDHFNGILAMCKKVTGKKISDEEEALQASIETLSEDKSSRLLERLDLLSRLREDVILRGDLTDRLLLCDTAGDLPDWWVPGLHDRDLLLGAAKHGLSRMEYYVLNDPDLCFKDILKKHLLGEDLVDRKEMDVFIKRKASPNGTKKDEKTKSDESKDVDETKNDSNAEVKPEVDTKEDGQDKEESKEEKEEEENVEKEGEKKAKKSKKKKKEKEKEEEMPSAPADDVVKETRARRKSTKDATEATKLAIEASKMAKAEAAKSKEKKQDKEEKSKDGKDDNAVKKDEAVEMPKDEVKSEASKEEETTKGKAPAQNEDEKPETNGETSTSGPSSKKERKLAVSIQPPQISLQQMEQLAKGGMMYDMEVMNNLMAQTYAAAIKWPKDRILEVRLGHVVTCVETGKWPVPNDYPLGDHLEEEAEDVESQLLQQQLLQSMPVRDGASTPRSETSELSGAEDPNVLTHGGSSRRRRGRKPLDYQANDEKSKIKSILQQPTLAGTDENARLDLKLCSSNKLSVSVVIA